MGQLEKDIFFLCSDETGKKPSKIEVLEKIGLCGIIATPIALKNYKAALLGEDRFPLLNHLYDEGRCFFLEVHGKKNFLLSLIILNLYLSK